MFFLTLIVEIWSQVETDNARVADGQGDDAGNDQGDVGDGTDVSGSSDGAATSGGGRTSLAGMARATISHTGPGSTVLKQFSTALRYVGGPR
jgi:hypothetical protein